MEHIFLHRSAVPALLLACVTGNAVIAADEQAVPAGPRKAADDDLTEIIVTGSRIARPELERLQPTEVITAEFLDRRAYTNVLDALRDLPAFGQPDNSLVGGQSSEGVGQSFANLFGLGSQRTLTLVNGRRFVPANSSSPFGPTGSGGDQVDLNTIPTKLIDRVEFISIGGAPVYGSDAIAGTINIILKHDYEGLDFDVQGGMSSRGDASQYRLRALAGTNFADNRGNVTLNVEFQHSDGLGGTQRPRYAAELGYFQSANPNPYLYSVVPHFELGGITTSGVPSVADGYLGFQPNLAIMNNAGQPLYFQGGSLVPYNPGTYDATAVNETGGNGINGAQTTTLLAPSERINATSVGSFQVNDHVRLFDELWFSSQHNAYPFAQGSYNTWLFGNAGSITQQSAGGNLVMSATNPFLSAADQATIARNLAAAGSPPGQFYLARLNQDISNGGATADMNTRRAVLGVSGDFSIAGHGFKYEVAGSYGRSENNSVSPSINLQNFSNALNAVQDPASGNIACAPGYVNSPVATQSSTCAPFNPFGYNVASRAAFAYVTTLATEQSVLTQRDFNASVNGDLFSLPAGAVKAVLGYENRRESSVYTPSPFFAQGAGYAIPLAPLSGSFMTNEVFSELLVPVISPDQAIPFVHRLELEGAGREVDHTIAGKAFTWTAGLRFEPVQQVQLRGNYTRAIRSPSLTEAFVNNQQAFTFANDPCDASLIGTGPNPALRAANCAKAGIVQPFSSQILNLSQPNLITGNTHLGNEVADSRTYGIVWRPVPRVSLAVDYISIRITQAITQLSATNVLNGCYDSTDYPNNQYCADFTRVASGANQGQIAIIKTPYANIGYENLNGIQTEINWSWDVPFARNPGSLGTVDVRLNEFFTNQLVQDFSSPFPLAGEVGNSRHRGTADITWHKDAVFVLWQARFTGKAAWDNFLPPTNTAITGLGNWWVHNLTLGYDPNDHLKLELVVDNVFDKEAPYPLPAVPPNSQAGGGLESYFSGVMGRYFLAQVAYRF